MTVVVLVLLTAGVVTRFRKIFIGFICQSFGTKSIQFVSIIFIAVSKFSSLTCSYCVAPVLQLHDYIPS